jgi:hypothetical protein
VTVDDWFTQVDQAANEYFAKPDSFPEVFVRIRPPPFVGAHPNPEEPRTYRVQYDLSGQGKHRIEPWPESSGRRSGGQR